MAAETWVRWFDDIRLKDVDRLYAPISAHPRM